MLGRMYDSVDTDANYRPNWLGFLTRNFFDQEWFGRGLLSP